VRLMLRRTDAKYMGMQGQIHKITLSAGGAERVAHVSEPDTS
jgi:hypothetical protein